MVKTHDDDYVSAVEFSLAAYGDSTLQAVRQAFPIYACMQRHEQLSAVCGVRGADKGLFLEQFMEQPAEDYIAAHYASSVARSAIAELGAFSTRSAALVPLFAAEIEKMLLASGFRHVLALSPSGASDLLEWCKERATMTSEKKAEAEPATLKVCVIPLTCPSTKNGESHA